MIKRPNIYINKTLKYIGSVFIAFYLINLNTLFAQSQEIHLTIDKVIEIAQNQSIESLVANQVFRQSQLRYKNYRATKKPQIDLSMGLVNYNRSASNRQYDYSTNDFQYYEVNTNQSSGNILFTQNIALTGGTISGGMDLVRNDNFESGASDYNSSPGISINQPLFAYNQFRWDNKIEPKKFEISKASYIQDREEVSLKAIDLFFDLAESQVALEVAKMNLHNTDTLYRISQGRYEMGKISENELLEMELKYMNSKSTLNSTEITYQQSKIKLLSFLRITENTDVELLIPDSVPGIQIDVTNANQHAKHNNPFILKLENQILVAQSEVNKMKAEKGFTADLNMAVGYSRVDENYPDIITDKDNITQAQNVALGVNIPILDWGVRQGNYEIALLNEEIVRLEAEQAIIDFDQALMLQVLNFNQQYDQFEIAKKSEIIAERRYEVSKQRFLVGKIAVLDLNVAQKDRDAEKSNFINALRNYWKSYYSIRQLTLFDYINDNNIEYLLNEEASERRNSRSN